MPATFFERPIATVIPLVPAQAGTQERYGKVRLDSHLRGNERKSAR
jgi:hypothetical protein